MILCKFSTEIVLQLAMIFVLHTPFSFRHTHKKIHCVNSLLKENQLKHLIMQYVFVGKREGWEVTKTKWYTPFFYNLFYNSYS